jgi:hypothetical protein
MDHDPPHIGRATGLWFFTGRRAVQQFLIGLAIVGLTLVAIAVSDRVIFGRWRYIDVGLGAGLMGAEELLAAALLIGAFLALLFAAFWFLIRSTLLVFDWSVARVQQGLRRNKPLSPSD